MVTPDGHLILELIRFPPHHDSYKSLVFRWKESIESFRNKLGPALSIPLYTSFNPGLENASVYITVSVDEKFEISQSRVAIPTSEKLHFHNGDLEYKGKRDLVDKLDYDIILKDKKRFDLRLPRNFFDPITVEFDVKIPKMVSLWLLFGIGMGVAVEFSLIFGGSSNLQYLIPLVGGAIAGLIALRLVLFHDIELLRTWNYLYFLIIGIMLLTLIIQIFMSVK